MKNQLFTTGGLVAAPVTSLYDMELADQLAIIDAIRIAQRNASQPMTDTEVQIARYCQNIHFEQRVRAKRHY